MTNHETWLKPIQQWILNKTFVKVFVYYSPEYLTGATKKRNRMIVGRKRLISLFKTRHITEPNFQYSGNNPTDKDLLIIISNGTEMLCEMNLSIWWLIQSCPVALSIFMTFKTSIISCLVIRIFRRFVHFCLRRTDPRGFYVLRWIFIEEIRFCIVADKVIQFMFWSFNAVIPAVHVYKTTLIPAVHVYKTTLESMQGRKDINDEWEPELEALI